ncbi:LysR family transcriptional regulator [Microbacterium dauci]|uniref:LysR family transcriptional regulator n=1 Tax=Microbacterium dauci TaxID=3048008 RepID=A0ABT6ZBW6_9MICO|nr:LysR family transcriptional regulator [Microbacterium sp. LX3-4]MDJ1113132.1 LysR family transcriptional regulator [Microbacterium sp. LX3-4]
MSHADDTRFAVEPDAEPRTDPRSLLVFRAVGRHGSMSAAADALGWTQPAVSQHVRRLERVHGVPLIARRGRGIELTPAGIDLLRHGDAVAAVLRDADRSLRAHADAESGVVRVAAFPSAMATLVSPAVRALAADRAGLELELTQLEPPEALRTLARGDCDIAIVFQYVEEQLDRDGFVAVPLGDDPMLAVLPRSHPGADATAIDLHDLADARWVAGCVNCRRHLLHAAARHGFAPGIRHSTDDYVVVQALVADDLAVAVLPALALAASRNPAVAAVPLAGEPPRRVVALTRPGAALPALHAVVDALRDAAAVATAPGFRSAP